jgi:Domain of unknown function (DUF4403)
MKNSIWMALSLAYAAGLTLSGCVPTVRPTAPNLPTTAVSEPPPSTIGLTISVPVKPLLDAAETNIPSSRNAREYVEFFGTGGPNRPSCGVGCGYDVSRSPLSFATHTNEITTSLSFSYWLSCTKRVPCRGPVVSGSCGKSEPRRRATESLTTQINTLPTWIAIATTKDNGVVAQDECAMGHLGVVNLTDKLAAGFSGLGKALDRKLNEGLSGLRSRAETAWDLLSNAIQVDADTWLEVKPESISISAVQVSGDTLRLAGGLIAHPRVEIGGRPPTAKRPLPDATPNELPGGSFAVYMPVKADYSAVEATLKRKLKIGGRGLHYPPTGSHYLTPTDVALYGYGQKAAFRVAFTGIAEGYAYFVGTPAFDVDTNLLSFPDLDYSPDTRKLALESIQWVDQDAFIHDLRTRLVVDLANPLSQAESKLSDALNHRYGNVQLAASISKPNLVSVYADPSKGQFVAYFDVSGTAAAIVEDK